MGLSRRAELRARLGILIFGPRRLSFFGRLAIVGLLLLTIILLAQYVGDNAYERSVEDNAAVCNYFRVEEEQLARLRHVPAPPETEYGVIVQDVLTNLGDAAGQVPKSPDCPTPPSP